MKYEGFKIDSYVVSVICFFYLRLTIMHCKVPLPPAEDGIQIYKKNNNN